MLCMNAVLEIEGKPEPNSWKDGGGNARFSYKLNVSQNEGRDLATLPCDESIYNSVKRRDVVIAELTYTEGSNERGKYTALKVVSIAPFAPVSSSPVSSSAPVSASASTSVSTPAGPKK